MSIEDRFKTIHSGDMPANENRMNFAENSVHSNNDVFNHEDNLGISLDDLKDKKTLNIGGTINGDFAEMAKRRGIDLVTFNPYYDIASREGSNLKAVGGFAQQMPFKENTFDIELALGSAPIYLPNYESEHRSFYTEIIRTLKKGGRAIIFPITGEIYASEVFLKIMKELETIANFHFLDEGVYSRTIDGEHKTAHFYRLTITKR